MAQRHDLHRRRASADGLLAAALQNASVEVKQQQQQQMTMMMKSSSPPVWDCGSSLYDSFELFTFSQQLHRAIAGEGILPSSLPSACIMKDKQHARSVSMPHFATTSTSHLYIPVVKEDEPMKDVDFSFRPKLEPLHPKTRNRFGVPKLLQRLLTRAFYRKARDRTKSETAGKHGKLGRSPLERMRYTAAY